MRNFTKIKVVGIGGSGGNALSRMWKLKTKEVEFIAINCDVQDLKHTKADKKIQIGKQLTKGLGAGADPNIGYRAALEQKDEIREALSGGNIIFITCGLGGGTGTKGSSVVAEIAKSEIGALTIGIVTLPFSFEGFYRKRVAMSGLEKLKEKVDALIVIENDKLLEKINDKIDIDRAFWVCDEVLRDTVFGIADLLFSFGVINVDFADIKEIMKDSGYALFGTGKGFGENMVEEAVTKAINFSLSGLSIKGATGILFNISARTTPPLTSIEKAAQIITREVSPSAKVIFGVTKNKKLGVNEARIVVIATGIKER
ncbi:cell division protein FtsZ [bacterium]|nr:cell division protein FtsZ [bacterium]